MNLFRIENSIPSLFLGSDDKRGLAIGTARSLSPWFLSHLPNSNEVMCKENVPSE